MWWPAHRTKALARKAGSAAHNVKSNRCHYVDSGMGTEARHWLMVFLPIVAVVSGTDVEG